jgi:hypothetical protein
MSKSVLKISDDLALPLEAVTNTFAIMGQRGSGKTHTATVMVEEMLKAGQPVCIYDPTGAWFGLKTSANGKSPGFPVVIFGGEHADIPLEDSAGAVVARFVIEKRTPAVLDCSLMRKGARVSFMADFLEELYHRNREPIHFVADEAHTIAPMTLAKTGRDDFPAARTLGAMEDIVLQGRRRGLGITVISQRPALVHTNVRTQCGTLVAMRLMGPHDLKAIKQWTDAHGTEEQAEQLLSSLATLKTGDGWVWSPSWLNVFKRTHFRSRETFDSSATPEVGKRVIAPKVIAKVDLDALGDEIRATIERAKADDPKALRAELAKVKTELQRLNNAKPVTETKVVKEPIITDAQMKEFTSAVKLMESAGKERIAAAEELASSGRELIQKAGEFAQAMARATNAPRPAPVAIRQPVARPSPNLGPIHNVMAGGEISGPERRILNAIAWFESIGVVPPAQPAVAFLAGYTYGGGGFNNPKGALRSKGLIRYVGDGLELTDEGKGLAVYPELSPTNAELHRKVLEILPNPEQRILKPLLERYPDAINNEDLAHAAGYKFGTGGFNNPRGRLRTLGLIEYRERRRCGTIDPFPSR